jgi:hypothetical protein
MTAKRKAGGRKESLDQEARLEAVQSEARSLKRELHEVKGALGRALDVRDLLAANARTMTPPPRWRPVKARKKPNVTALVLFGDAHVGERTDPAQAEGWGRYSYAIAQRRTENYLRCLTQWLTTLRAGYCIEDCAVVLLGDMTSGDIHEELMRTNEFPPPVQAVAAGRLVAALVSGLAGQFHALTVYGVGGSNHGRLSRKYQFKGGVLNNWDFVVYEHARALLARHANVALHVLSAKKEAVRIANHWFLCGHGDHVKSWMGIPWYGIERDLGRESRRRLDRLQEQLRRDTPVEGLMDYGLGAHWHTPFVGPSFRYIVNGSLSGTNEFDHSCGRHAAPQQVAALISPKHGLFGPVAWRLDTEDEAKLQTNSTDLFTEGPIDARKGV